MRMSLLLAAVVFCSAFATVSHAEDPWVVYPGGEGAGKGKHIVFISGDEEYRSEEGLPQLAKILSKHHGFKCTVLFAVDAKTGEINPNFNSNIPGTEALNSADLMIILTRFRNLPDAQMKPIDDFLKAGKPVIGLRTATHAFAGIKGAYAHYNWDYNNAEKADWKQGFGRLVLGETWINHHGGHMSEGTRGLIVKDNASSPILRGIKDGDIFGDTDVYGVRLPLPGDSKPLILGQVTRRVGPNEKGDPHYGMRPTDPPLEGKDGKPDKKNDPMMPVAWTKTYNAGGKEGKAFTTTMGSSTDLVSAGLRRLLVNAAYSLLGMDDKIPTEGSKVDIVGEYKPSAYRGGGYVKGVKPGDLGAK
jgi:hypothetical protein